MISLDWAEHPELERRRMERIHERATAQGRDDARALMAAVRDWRAWELVAAARGTEWALIARMGVVQALRLLGVDSPFVIGPGMPVELLSSDAEYALKWYDIAFRGALDEALDDCYEI